MGKPCITTVHDMSLTIHGDKHMLSSNKSTNWFNSGDMMTLDGGNGLVYKTTPAPTMSLMDDPDFQKVLHWADQFRRLRIEANITSNTDMCEQIKFAQKVGADAIGCISTDAMFNSTENRLSLTRAILMKRASLDKVPLLKALGTIHHQDFLALFRCAMHGKAVVKLLDWPLSRFLPCTENEIEMYANEMNMPVAEIKQIIAHTEDRNPDIGLRGCRISSYYTEITEMQVKLCVYIFRLCVHKVLCMSFFILIIPR